MVRLLNTRFDGYLLVLQTEDVLKARLKTLGVIEHKFTLQGASARGIDWKIFDVGGTTNQRHAWAPYFEDGVFYVAALS